MSYYAGSGYYPTAYAGSSYGVPVARSYSSYDAPMMPARQYYPTTPVYSAPPMVMSHRPSYSYPVSTMPMGSPMPYYGGSQPTVIISRSGRHHHRSSSRSSRSSSRHRSFLHYL